MFETNELIQMQERRGAGHREMDIFCYFAYYPYLNG